MDEERQADGAGGAQAPAWPSNGAAEPSAAGYPHAYRPAQGWSGAVAAPEPAAEPLALRTPGPHLPRQAHPGPAESSPDPPATHPSSTGSASVPPDSGRRYAPGLDDDTPVSGTPAVEPPLWREAARHSPSSSAGYASLADYPPPAYPAAGDSTAAYPDQPYPEPAYPERAYPEPAYPEPAYQPPRTYPDLSQPLQPPTRPDAEPAPDRPSTETPQLATLPQRVPSEPDVPDLPESGNSGRERWTAPELAWIADQLKRDDVPQGTGEGFDVDAVVAAVREVPGVRTASVKASPTGMHTLRLDLADDADPGEVSRVVARLLEQRMGLSAAPNDLAGPADLAGFAEQAREPAAAPTTDPDSIPAPALDSAPASDPARAAEIPEPRDPAATPPRRRARAAEPVSSPPPPPPDFRPTAGGSATEVPSPSEATNRAERASRAESANRAESQPPPGRRRAAHASTEDETERPGIQTGTAFSEGRWGGSAGGLARRGPRRARPEPEEAELPVEPEPVVEEPEVVSRPLYPPHPGLRVVIDEVRVSTVGFDAKVEVELTAGQRRAHGLATGPAVDSYVVRLAAVSAANAIDMLLYESDPQETTLTSTGSRCFVEHTSVVPFGNTEVAVVVLLLVCGGWVEQLTGSALVDGDPRQAMVRATLGAVNRRLEALLG